MRRPTERPRSIKEIAQMLDWSYDCTKAHLMRLNAELHGMLLRGGVSCRKCKGRDPHCPNPHRVGKYTVTIAALRAADPDLFEAPMNLAEVVAHHVDLSDIQQAQIKALESRVQEINREISRIRNMRGTSGHGGQNRPVSA